MADRVKNRGSALLMTLIGAGILSICSLMMLSSGMTQLKLQRRIVMQENNFCCLEQKMEELRAAVDELTEEIVKECGKKALREAARAAKEAAREAAKEAEEEASTEETKTSDGEEIDLELAQEFYRERVFRKMKRRLRPKELEKLLTEETMAGTAAEAGKEAVFSITEESVTWEEDTILVKGLRLSGSAPGSRIRSSVSADVRISIPELICEEVSDESSYDESCSGEESPEEASPGEACFKAKTAGKALAGEAASESESYSLVTLEHFRREKRKTGK